MPDPVESYNAPEGGSPHAHSLWRRLTGPQLLSSSFLLLILLATLLLLFLPGLYRDGTRLSLIDSLVMATAAVCITGLSVIDLATEFTPFGQVVYLILIQIGGLGILTVTTMVILWVGGRVSLRSEAALGSIGAGPAVSPRELMRAILRYALGIEAVGAILLWLGWVGELGALGAIWPAIFHAVSAFCNAGVSNLPGGLVEYRDNPFILAVVIGLVVLGGLGFLVLEELLGRGREPRSRLSLHTKVVLLTTAVLILGGAVVYGLLEWNVALGDGRWSDRLIQALFLSTTPRTAGFTIIDYNDLSAASLIITIILMMVGGSPGSTAGGLKTTTIAVIVALAIARIRGETVTRAFRHTIPESTIQRAVGLIFVAGAVLVAAILTLLVVELGGISHEQRTGDLLKLAFEAVGAFNTTGLSMGVTRDLATMGKLIIVALMYIGRVGPLTFAASMVITAGRARPRVRYSTEDLIIG